jgi:RNA polymerase-binding transcription factor DksA
MNNYDDVKHTLTALLEELTERLAHISDDVRHTDQPAEKNFAEQATQNENNEVLDQLGNAARTEITFIKQALARIDKGVYGICEVCDEPIRAERLKAVPYSSMCVKCASKAGH